MDPDGGSAGAIRVIRGGSFHVQPRYCRAAYRYGIAPSRRNFYFGFPRCSGSLISAEFVLCSSLFSEL